MLELLPDDGARYRCSYGTFLYGEEWRCNNNATHAIIELPEPRKFEIFHARAMCNTHIRLLLGDIN